MNYDQADSDLDLTEPRMAHVDPAYAAEAGATEPFRLRLAEG